MPKPDYPHTASVAVACEGPGPGTVRITPFGTRRSRDGAQLAHVEADARQWHEAFRKGPHSTVDHHVLLVNPTREVVLEAISSCSAALEPFTGEEGWLGGQINFAFAGHGSPAGGLVLSDGELGGRQIVDTIRSSGLPTAGKRRLALVLDSCHSGRTLVEVLAEQVAQGDFLLVDGFAACLHDESAWEIDYLGHGALTFAMGNRGNAHVDGAKLARAFLGDDREYLRFALQSSVPSSVALLTDGDQTSFEVINGWTATVHGADDNIVLDPDTFSLDGFLSSLEDGRAKLRGTLGLHPA